MIIPLTGEIFPTNTMLNSDWKFDESHVCIYSFQESKDDNNHAENSTKQTSMDIYKLKKYRYHNTYILRLNNGVVSPSTLCLVVLGILT